MKPTPSEHAEQVSLVQWLGSAHPELDYFAIPNGGNRNIITARKLKAEGVKPGVPDLFFPSLKLFIELKRTKGGAVSKEQRFWSDRLGASGYRVAVCRGAEEALTIIEGHINGQ
jgi:hypothetical protein